MPGVGISIGLTRLFYILSTMGYLNASAAGPAVLVIPMTSDLSYAIGTATAMRAAGVPAQIYFEQKKFKHKIGYADKLGIPFAAFIGEDEIAAGKVTLKNMTTGEQVTQPLDALIPVILEQLEKSREQKIITVD